jgi:hypothetical protein
MDLPNLKYTYADGRKASEFIVHDGVECRYVEQPDGSGAWYTRSGLALTQGCSIGDGEEEETRTVCEYRGQAPADRSRKQRKNGTQG